MHSPDDVAAGSDDFDRLGPPIIEEAAESGTSRARPRADGAAASDEVGGALAGGEVVQEPAAPSEVGGVDAALGRDEVGTKGSEHPVKRAAGAPRPEAVEHVESVQFRQTQSGQSFTVTVTVEVAMPSVKTEVETEDTEQAGVGVPPAAPGQSGDTGVRSAAPTWWNANAKVALRTLASAGVGIVSGLYGGPAVGVAVFIAVLLVAMRTRPAVPMSLALLLFPVMAALDVLHQPKRLDNVASYALMLLVVSLVLLWLDLRVQLSGTSATPTPGTTRVPLRRWSRTGTELTPATPNRGGP